MARHSLVLSDTVGISKFRQRWSGGRRWLVNRPRLVTFVTAAIITLAVWGVLFWGSATQSSSFDRILVLSHNLYLAQRQQTLSQRITLYSSENDLISDQKAASVKNELLSDFEEAHDNLQAEEAAQAYDAFLEAVNGGTFDQQLTASENYLDAMEVHVLRLEDAIANEVGEDDDVRKWVVAVTAILVFGLVLLGWFFIRDLRLLLESEKRMIQYLFHEIRNPLNHVINGIEAVLTDSPYLGAEVSSQLKKCQEGGEFITRLLDDVLNIAKIESGFPLDLEPTSVSELCASAVRVSGLSALSSGVTCDFQQGSGAGGEYYVDATRLSQVLLNLLSNAVKYVGYDGVVHLKLDLVKRGTTGHLLSFCVEDNGPGLEADDRNNLFERFSTFHKTSGAGLGLHLTNLIVRRMGGKVSVASPVPGADRGAAFSFSIWLKQVDDVAKTDGNGDAVIADAPRGQAQHSSAVSIPIDASPKALASSLRGLRILVVDDETVNVHILARKFRRDPIGQLEWHVESAPSLPECLEKATQGAPFDVIFMDDHFQNDELTGSVYIRTLRARGVNAAVIMVSGNCTAADEAKYRKRGAVGLVPKPIPGESAVLAIVDKALRLHAESDVSQ